MPGRTPILAMNKAIPSPTLTASLETSRGFLGSYFDRNLLGPDTIAEPRCFERLEFSSEHKQIRRMLHRERQTCIALKAAMGTREYTADLDYRADPQGVQPNTGRMIEVIYHRNQVPNEVTPQCNFARGEFRQIFQRRG
jgi:hypothetical protein